MTPRRSARNGPAPLAGRWTGACRRAGRRVRRDLGDARHVSARRARVSGAPAAGAAGVRCSTAAAPEAAAARAQLRFAVVRPAAPPPFAYKLEPAEPECQVRSLDRRAAETSAEDEPGRMDGQAPVRPCSTD